MSTRSPSGLPGLPQKPIDVFAAAERLDLAGEDTLEAVIVRDRGEREGVGRQCNGRDRRPVALEPADELGGEVLGVGRATAVAEAENLSTGADAAHGTFRKLDLAGRLQ